MVLILGNSTFSEVASMAVIWWIVNFLPSEHTHDSTQYVHTKTHEILFHQVPIITGYAETDLWLGECSNQFIGALDMAKNYTVLQS